MKKLLLLFVLSALFALTACGNEEAFSATNFEYDPEVMISQTLDEFQAYYVLSDVEKDYYINEGTDLEKAAASGFEMLQTTDHAGDFQNFNTTDGKVTIKDGNNDDILCTITAQYENREVQFTVYYQENRKFAKEMDSLYGTLEQQAAYYGFGSVAELIEGMYKDYGYDTSTVTAFMTEVLSKEQGIKPYNPYDCEVSAVYSKSELLAKAGKNTAIGMFTVFAVLIFISLIISLLKFVPLLFDKNAREAHKKQKEAEAAKLAAANKPAKVEKEETVKIDAPAKTAVSQALPAAASLGESSEAYGDEMSYDELVAVISAAIAAYSSENTVTRKEYTTDSKDKLVVRSIRRVR